MEESLIIATIKWVLGEDFIDNMDQYHVNTDICLHFVASLLDSRMVGLLTSKITKVLFSQNYLEGVGGFCGIPHPFQTPSSSVGFKAPHYFQ